MARDIFEIDQDLLDEEWVDQVKLMRKWTRRLAVARKRYEEAKANIKVVVAKLDRQMREDPDEFGIQRVTDKVIEAAIPAHRFHINATKKLIHCKYVVDVLNGYVDTLDHRKKALENLVHLLAMDYFAPPRKTKASQEVASKMDRRATARRGDHSNPRSKKEEDDE